MKLHSELIQEDFLNEYDKQNKDNHENLMKSESANFGLLFLFDLLQFFYQFLSNPIQKTLDKDLFMSQDIAKYGRMHGVIPNYLNHKFDYTVNDSVKLVSHILRAIKQICPNPSHLLELWLIRKHIETKLGVGTEDEVREDQSYERTDKFNTVGLMMYMYWCLKPRVNSTVDGDYQHDRFEELEGFESPLPETVTREFEFEILYPLLAVAIHKRNRYATILESALEILSYY